MYAVISEDKAQSSWVLEQEPFIPHKEHKSTTGMYAVVSEDKAQSSQVLEQEPFIPHKEHKSTTGMYAVVSEDKASSPGTEDKAQSSPAPVLECRNSIHTT